MAAIEVFYEALHTDGSLAGFAVEIGQFLTMLRTPPPSIHVAFNMVLVEAFHDSDDVIRRPKPAHSSPWHADELATFGAHDATIVALQSQAADTFLAVNMVSTAP